MEVDHASLWRHLWTYCTSLFAGPEMLQPSTVPDYSASATLVLFDGNHCMLTAAHVWDFLSKHGSVAFVTDTEHPLLWAPVSSLQLLRRVKGTRDEWGPDIALVKLHKREVDRLKATKAFYDLDRDPAVVAAAEDTWVMVGTPGEFLRMDAPEAAYLSNHTLGSSQPTHLVHETLEHVDVPFGATDVTKIPTFWGGLSGAGLWQCGLAPNVKGDALTIEGRPRLAGVVFYQLTSGPKRGVIRCHGLAPLRATPPSP